MEASGSTSNCSWANVIFRHLFFEVEKGGKKLLNIPKSRATPNLTPLHTSHYLEPYSRIEDYELMSQARRKPQTLHQKQPVFANLNKRSNSLIVHDIELYEALLFVYDNAENTRESTNEFSNVLKVGDSPISMSI